MLKIDDLKAMDDKTIVAKVSALKTDIFRKKIQKGVSGMEKPHTVKDAKRDIARLLTVLNSRKTGK
jgi:large subunit ribosomal protein L29